MPADANRDTAVVAMIETPDGLANAEAICGVAGLDGVSFGPSDLRLAAGGSSTSLGD